MTGGVKNLAARASLYMGHDQQTKRPIQLCQWANGTNILLIFMLFSYVSSPSIHSSIIILDCDCSVIKKAA